MSGSGASTDVTLKGKAMFLNAKKGNSQTLATPASPSNLFYDVTSIHRQIFKTQAKRSASTLRDIRDHAEYNLGANGAEMVTEVFSKVYDSTLQRSSEVSACTAANVIKALESDFRFKRIQRACEGSPAMAAAITKSILEPILDSLNDEGDEEQAEADNEEQNGGQGGQGEGDSEGDANPYQPQRVSQDVMRAAMHNACEKVEDLHEMCVAFGCEDPETREEHEERETLLGHLDDKSLKAIMDIAGKLVPMAASKVRMNVERGIGEYTKLTTSDNIVDAVLSDIALLASDFTALGMKKIAEKELVTWDKELREQQGKGPIVFCIDHSASMHGSPLEWAKALLLGLARFAALQNRPFAVVWFNHQARVNHYPVGTRPTELLADLNVSACGGTYFDRALGEAVEAIKQTPALKGADLVFLTDGYDEVEIDWKAEFDALNVNALGVVIEGGTGGLEAFCDQVLSIEDLTVENAAQVFDGIKM